MEAPRRSTETSPSTPTNGSNNNHRRKPPKDCEGYPPALQPKLDGSPFVDVDFYIPKGESNDAPELACTFTWYKGDNASTFYSNEECVGPTCSPEDTTIEDVQSTIVIRGDSRPVVIVCHGFLSWRNQMLISHVAAGVAKALQCHALRFDFRRNGSSGGTWHSAGFDNELRDLERVVNYVRQELGFKVACIVGHSKGTAAVLRFAHKQSTCEHGDGVGDIDSTTVRTSVPCFVNMAGRFTTPADFDIKTRFTTEQCGELKRTGKFVMETFGGKKVVVTQQDIDERTNADMTFVSDIQDTSVLTIHGGADTTVSPDNAYKYDECISKHTLKIIDGADHNFSGLKYMKEIVSCIAGFVEIETSNT